MIHRIPLNMLSMANILDFAAQGDVVESSRVHVGPTTAALPHFYIASTTSIKTQVVDITFNDHVCTPHLSVSNAGTVQIGDPSIVTYMMSAQTSVPHHNLTQGQSVADWHMSQLRTVFPQAIINTSSSIFGANQMLVIQIIQAAWEYIATHDVHRFKHFIESDGRVVRKDTPLCLDEVLDNLANITGPTGWKIPNIITIVLDMILGSKSGSTYYHLCGGSMWSYIDGSDYQPLIRSILDKMKRFGREMYLINTTHFRVFSLREDSNLIDKIWACWKRLVLIQTHKNKVRLEAELVSLIRSKKLPWYDKCEGKRELTQHDLTASVEMYVPTWALYANFEELSKFLAFTVQCWKSGKK